ncbi:hypothetical protein B0H15DRAFT_852901 [Mycena belliarum]|uniref:Uncharacterized protein n=1 Tax=Mycena belliarum TaxID=1033014 RepID=A0AAD6TY81_9AGAR|nr:hypothetical protein B0H15DRAFT_852901 [Mycena belliae]
MLFHDANDFALGQIIWCDHGDPDIDASSRGHYLDAATSTGGKIRPCLIVGIDVKNKNLTLAPISSFRDGSTHWHPGWEPLAHDEFPIHLHSQSNSIWMGRPATTDMLLGDPEMHTERPEFSAWSLPPTSSTNYNNYWKRREIYAKRFGTDDPFILKTYGERQSATKAKSGTGRDSLRGRQSARHGTSQGPTAKPPQSEYNKPPAMPGHRGVASANPPRNQLATNHNIGAPPNEPNPRGQGRRSSHIRLQPPTMPGHRGGLPENPPTNQFAPNHNIGAPPNEPQHHGRGKSWSHARLPMQGGGGDSAPRTPLGGYDRRQTSPPMNWRPRNALMNQPPPAKEPWPWPGPDNAREMVSVASPCRNMVQKHPLVPPANYPHTRNFGGYNANALRNNYPPPTAYNGPGGSSGDGTDASTGPSSPTPRRRRRGKHK